jgi:hypothetical protein
MDDLKENRDYWKLKKEALDHTLWGTRFGKSYGPVVRPDSGMNHITYALRYLTRCMKIRNFGINGNNSMKRPVNFH